MNSAPNIDPANRQVLINLGNRFVVFGPEGGLPEPLRFDPKNSPTVPRVADELDKEYTVRNEAAHDYKLLPKDAREISSWLSKLQGLVDKF
jgi:hypothetical protein